MPVYVVIEGCIGVGKTTMAIELSKRLRTNKLIEDTTACPFIREFYLDPKSNALETELSFTVIHYHQIAEAARQRLFDGNVVSDFFYEKDLIFPKVTLREEEANIVRYVWRRLRKRLPDPDIVVYLDAPTELLFKRVKYRGRDFESPITFAYLDEINRAYKAFMRQYDRSEVIMLDATTLDKSLSRDSFGDAEVLLRKKMAESLQE